MAPRLAKGDSDSDSDTDSASAPIEQVFATETMAELSARQGRTADAIAIYRHLLAGGRSAGLDDDERRRRWAERLLVLESTPPSGRAPPTAGRRPLSAAPRSAAGAPTPPPLDPPTPPTPPVSPTAFRLPMVVRQPVRSGQIVYAEKNDLIVMAPVNSGAQVIADGNIHIYAPLRGRAVAGVRGAVEAQVFCLALEAELVGVDVGYIPSAEIPASSWGRPMRIFLRDGVCVLEPLVGVGAAARMETSPPPSGWRWGRKPA